jgi:hypothetical protein
VYDHIFVFTYRTNNCFQNKLVGWNTNLYKYIYSCSAIVVSFESDCFQSCYEHEYMNVHPLPPPQLSRLVTTLFIRPDHL